MEQVDCDAMALSDVLGPIRRRWYVLLLGLLLAGGLGWAAGTLAPSQYTARGLVMLLPSALTTGTKGNPLLNLGGLELPARVLIAYYSSEPAQAELAKLSPKAEVQVSMEESTRGPIIAVDVKDATPDGALSVLHYVTDSIPENLARIQSEVGTSRQAAIGSMPLVLDVEARPDISLTVRLVVASIVAVLALTFFVIFSLDGILLRRVDSDSGDDNGLPDGGRYDSKVSPGRADVNESATGDRFDDHAEQATEPASETPDPRSDSSSVPGSPPDRAAPSIDAPVDSGREHPAGDGYAGARRRDESTLIEGAAAHSDEAGAGRVRA